MTNSKVLFHDLVNKIRLGDDAGEIHAITYALMESQFGLTKTDIMSEKALAAIDWGLLESRLQRINRQEPIQYILGETEFYGRKFIVNPPVLIPRPETELIIRDVIDADHNGTARGTILDIGTGSGCIAVTLAKEFPGRNVAATDVSTEALVTAAKNAKLNHASVEFSRHNILTDDLPLKNVEWIVSNPPYVTDSEKGLMKKNVLAYEPSLALFVPDDDPLIFYKAIIHKGKTALKAGGRMVVEINEKYGSEVTTLFLTAGYYSPRITKDFAHKDRIVSAQLGS